MNTINNILIIKPGAIGDLLQLTPVVRALKKKLPAARISLLVGNVVSTELFRYNEFVHEIIVFDRKGEHSSWEALVKLWRRLRASRYDLVLNFQRSNFKAWLLATAAFPCRLLVYHKAKKRIVHAVVNHLETLAPLGIDAVDTALEFYVDPESDKFAENLFATKGLTGRNVVALNPGASQSVNRWSPAHFARLTDKLMNELAVKVVIIGGGEDIALAGEITSQALSRPVNLAGTTTLLQLGAILKRCHLLVTGDTGPMHMATAVNTRVIALFGAADPARTGPVGEGHRVIQAEEVDCAPCRSRHCSRSTYLECMERITVDEVYHACASMLPDKEDRF